jgi:Flp pilus assembly CpaF family ATPase
MVWAREVFSRQGSARDPFGEHPVSIPMPPPFPGQVPALPVPDAAQVPPPGAFPPAPEPSEPVQVRAAAPAPVQQAPADEASAPYTQPVPLPAPTTVPVFNGVQPLLPTMAQLSPSVRTAAQLLLDYIGDDESSEVLMNGPNEISHKVRGVRYHCPELQFGDAETYHRVINEVILVHTDTVDRIDGRTVVIEGQLQLHSPGRPPMLARVHVVAPPGVSMAKVTIAKKPRFNLTLDDLAANGTLSQVEADFLNAATRGRRTMVVSGPTGSGKTTVLQALTHCFDANERVVVIEETPELRLPLGDVVYLRATLERPGVPRSHVFDLGFWVKQANRMRMDRVIVGETRGREMADWLLAANSGAEGSATTVHANSPRRTLDKMLSLATKAENAPSEPQLRREIAATVELIVQVGLVDGRHLITAIEEVSATVATNTGHIQTNTLFEYDRNLGQHVARNRPSEDFLAGLAERGVPVNNAWFR